MIAVLTCSRRPVDYLPATLAAIDESATSKHKIVVIDGYDAPSVPPGWRVTIAPKPAWEWRVHNRFPFWSCLELAVEATDDLIFFEDDITLCRNGARYAEAVRVPDDLALLSLFAPFGGTETPAGIQVSDARLFTFCQGLKIPLRTCQTLVANRDIMAQSRLGGSDNCIAAVGDLFGWKIGTLCPSIVQHVGEHSAVSERVRVDRVSHVWPGKDFDAMTLLNGGA